MLVSQEIVRSNPGRIIVACSVDNGRVVYVAVASSVTGCVTYIDHVWCGIIDIDIFRVINWAGWRHFAAIQGTVRSEMFQEPSGEFEIYPSSSLKMGVLHSCQEIIHRLLQERWLHYSVRILPHQSGYLPSCRHFWLYLQQVASQSDRCGLDPCLLRYEYR